LRQFARQFAKSGAPFLLTAAIAGADRLTKVAVERNISFWDTVPVIPGVVNLVYTRNPGAAFGFLRDAPPEVRFAVLLLFSGLVAGVLAYLVWRGTEGRWVLAAILGGAIGNLYDRLVSGSVTDFVQVFIGSYEWPSFNVADSAISIGAVLILLSGLRRPGRAPGPPVEDGK
jgi:signal peptidase II